MPETDLEEISSVFSGCDKKKLIFKKRKTSKSIVFKRHRLVFSIPHGCGSG